ncbi:hypothetical protein AAFF_G00147180 [Aldrovandia affinis]|uniref:Uncharacterized protein n=1 Tax=Aldrovandia affinis TaxID=143900 RepID=A0AAD7RPZ6_9TELE|nr:hypothetical protein AAFF_G00147180 [Aldrovandia affinis]
MSSVHYDSRQTHQPQYADTELWRSVETNALSGTAASPALVELPLDGSLMSRHFSGSARTLSMLSSVCPQPPPAPC